MMDIEDLVKLIKWSFSEDALDESIRLPRGCHPMNGPERITAEICVQNLQKDIRKKYYEIRKAGR
jgi:hypothetical protein